MGTTEAALIKKIKNGLLHKLLKRESDKQNTTTSNLSRQNHYVPVWYQKGFLLPGETNYFYLDLLPRRIQLPDGRMKILNKIRKRFPEGCFFEKDLYTTSFLSLLNDEIEKYLFGDIDTQGSKAVHAVINNNNFTELHHCFIRFFEYLDAQKIRTPKGLDWIKSKYPKLPQNQLMQEMQCLRRMSWF